MRILLTLLLTALGMGSALGQLTMMGDTSAFLLRQEGDRLMLYQYHRNGDLPTGGEFFVENVTEYKKKKEVCYSGTWNFETGSVEIQLYMPSKRNPDTTKHLVINNKIHTLDKPQVMFDIVKRWFWHWPSPRNFYKNAL